MFRRGISPVRWPAPGATPRSFLASDLRSALVPGLLCALVATLLLATGCESSKKLTRARDFADGYFALLQAGRLDEAYAVLAPSFVERTSREAWLEQRRRVDERLGPMRTFRMERWSMEVLPNGTFVTFEYDVACTQGNSRDTVTVVLPVRKDAFLVFGHHVHSPLLEGD